MHTTSLFTQGTVYFIQSDKEVVLCSHWSSLMNLSDQKKQLFPDPVSAWSQFSFRWTFLYQTYKVSGVNYFSRKFMLCLHAGQYAFVSMLRNDALTVIIWSEVISLMHQDLFNTWKLQDILFTFTKYLSVYKWLSFDFYICVQPGRIIRYFPHFVTSIWWFCFLHVYLFLYVFQSLWTLYLFFNLVLSC